MNETQVVAIQNIILWLDMSNYVYVCCVCCFLVESIPDYWVDICQSDCWLQRLLGGQMVELLWASQETAVVNDCSGSPWEISECVCVCVCPSACVCHVTCSLLYRWPTCTSYSMYWQFTCSSSPTQRHGRIFWKQSYCSTTHFSWWSDPHLPSWTPMHTTQAYR